MKALLLTYVAAGIGSNEQGEYCRAAYIAYFTLLYFYCLYTSSDVLRVVDRETRRYETRHYG